MRQTHVRQIQMIQIEAGTNGRTEGKGEAYADATHTSAKDTLLAADTEG